MKYDIENKRVSVLYDYGRRWAELWMLTEHVNENECVSDVSEVGTMYICKLCDKNRREWGHAWKYRCSVVLAQRTIERVIIVKGGEAP